MNLSAIASGVTSSIAPLRTITVLVSNGSTTQLDGTQVPNTIAVSVQGQVQALSSGDLEQVENISQQANMRTVYMPGNLPGIDRTHQWGGDRLQFDGDTWLVTQMAEAWPGWCRLIVVRQLPSSA